MIDTKKYSFNDHFKASHLLESVDQMKLGLCPSEVIGSCSQITSSFSQECTTTAKIIFQEEGHGIVIILTGNISSEIMLRSFLTAKIPFKVMILRFKYDLNIAEVALSVSICTRFNVEFELFDLDILDFWNLEAEVFANLTRCTSPLLLALMKLLDEIDGIPVLGNLDYHYVKSIQKDYIPGISPYSDSAWSLEISYSQMTLFRFFQLRNRNAVPSFFFFRPELVYAYLQLPVVKKLIQNKVIGKLSNESSKNAIYADSFLKLNDQVVYPKGKLKEQLIDYENVLKVRYPKALKKVHIDTLELEKHLSSLSSNR